MENAVGRANCFYGPGVDCLTDEVANTIKNFRLVRHSIKFFVIIDVHEFDSITRAEIVVKQRYSGTDVSRWCDSDFVVLDKVNILIIDTILIRETC